MSPHPEPLPRDIRESRLRLGRAFQAQQFTNPARYAEVLAMIDAMATRAEHWRSHEIRLPHGVQVVPMLDDDRTVYIVDWGREPPPAPPIYFHDHCLAVELSWTVFMLRRPWAIDDERLRALVEHPPAPRARILGELLSIRFAAWARRAFGLMAQACIETPPPDHPIGALEDVFRDFAGRVRIYEARADLSIRELSGLLDVAEPDAGLGHEIARWRCMLGDYTQALDGPLHERVEALTERFEGPTPKGVPEALETLLDCRQMDACLGLLLARAAMLDPNARPSIVRGHVDPMATRAAESFGWWCRMTLDAWDDEYPLGDRLRPDEVPTFLRFALHKLQELDAGLLEAVLRVCPIDA